MPTPTPNDDRSRAKDPMQPDFKAGQDNRSGQKDPQQQQEPGSQAQPGGQSGTKPRQGSCTGKKK